MIMSVDVSLLYVVGEKYWQGVGVQARRGRVNKATKKVGVSVFVIKEWCLGGSAWQSNSVGGQDWHVGRAQMSLLKGAVGRQFYIVILKNHYISRVGREGLGRCGGVFGFNGRSRSFLNSPTYVPHRVGPRRDGWVGGWARWCLRVSF